MPYKSTKQLNPFIKEAIPSEAGRHIFLEAFNAADKRGLSEAACFRTSWYVLKKRGFEKNEKGKWVKK